MEAVPQLKFFISRLQSYLSSSTSSEQDFSEKTSQLSFQEPCSNSKFTNSDKKHSIGADPILLRQVEAEPRMNYRPNKVIINYVNGNHLITKTEDMKTYSRIHGTSSNDFCLVTTIKPTVNKLIENYMFNTNDPILTNTSRTKRKYKEITYEHKDVQLIFCEKHNKVFIKFVIPDYICYRLLNIMVNNYFTQPFNEQTACIQNMAQRTFISCGSGMCLIKEFDEDQKNRLKYQVTEKFCINERQITENNSRNQNLTQLIFLPNTVEENRCIETTNTYFCHFENNEETTNQPDRNKAHYIKTDTLVTEELDMCRNEDSASNGIKEIYFLRNNIFEFTNKLTKSSDVLKNCLEIIQLKDIEKKNMQDVAVNKKKCETEIRKVKGESKTQEMEDETEIHEIVQGICNSLLETVLYSKFESKQSQNQRNNDEDNTNYDEDNTNAHNNDTHVKEQIKHEMKIIEDSVPENILMHNKTEKNNFEPIRNNGKYENYFDHEQRVHELLCLLENLKLQSMKTNRKISKTLYLSNIKIQPQKNITTVSSSQDDFTKGCQIDQKTSQISNVTDLETKTHEKGKPANSNKSLSNRSTQVALTKTCLNYMLQRSPKDINLRSRRMARAIKETELQEYEEEVETLLPDPVHMDWKTYHRLIVIYNFLDKLESDYPSLCSVNVIGHTFEGREIMVLKVSNSQENNASVWIDAGIHAREWIAPAVITYIANYIVKNFNSLPKYMTDIDWYFLPVANPDGYEYTHTDDRFWRKNRAAKNGHCFGVDLNRNFSYGWGCGGSSSVPTHCFYRGQKPFSEPESQAIRDAILHSGIKFKVYLSLHCYGKKIIFPFACKEELCPDYVRLLQGAAVLSKAIFETSGNIYKAGTSKDMLYRASGTSQDWCHGVAHIPYCYLIELCDKKYRFKLPPTNIEATGKEILNSVMALMKFVHSQPVDIKNGGCCEYDSIKNRYSKSGTKGTATEKLNKREFQVIHVPQERPSLQSVPQYQY